jgi:hypothetical protein
MPCGALEVSWAWAVPTCEDEDKMDRSKTGKLDKMHAAKQEKLDKWQQNWPNTGQSSQIGLSNSMAHVFSTRSHDTIIGSTSTQSNKGKKKKNDPGASQFLANHIDVLWPSSPGRGRKRNEEGGRREEEEEGRRKREEGEGTHEVVLRGC